MAATIRITPTAWMKMQTLVMGYDKEVGWFGTCEHVAPLEFRIKDILVFPQYTGGCTGIGHRPRLRAALPVAVADDSCIRCVKGR